MFGYELIGLLVLILDIYVIYLIATGSGDPGIKLLWIILVLLLRFSIRSRSSAWFWSYQGLILELPRPLADTSRLSLQRKSAVWIDGILQLHHWRSWRHRARMRV